PRRLRADPRLLRTNHPSPTRPQRRPPTQPRAPHDPDHPPPMASTHDRLHHPSTRRRQKQPRSKPLPQALPRTKPLPAPRTPANDHLTNIEASLVQATFLFWLVNLRLGWIGVPA